MENQLWELPLMIATCILVLFVNLACLYLVHRKSKTKRPSSIAILNLLSCHVTQGVFVIPFYILKRAKLEDTKVARPVCDTFRFLYMVTNYVLCLSVLLITIDRAFAIKKPLLYRSTMTNQKMVYASLSSWIYIVILCIVPFIPASGTSSKCSYNPQREWTLVMLTCNTMLPFIIIVSCYIIIFKSAQRSRLFRTKSWQENNNSSQSRAKESELRIAKISFFIVSAYILCWGPSFVYYFLSAACSSCFRASYLRSEAEPIVTFIMKYLTFLNGIINPIIYCIAHMSLKHVSNNKNKRYAVRRRAYTFGLNRHSEELTSRKSTVSQVTIEESV